ncbi:AAA family ATPase [Candidatus Peregrinibacteria bacterium]|jgi:cytidylate kinase|nr:AAA family ATPase [Candidatus Peregrinibacteria bacterium]
MALERPIVIGGCPGTGKSSASRELSNHLDNCVLIETDNFFDYLIDPLDPSTPAAKVQNEIVISAYAEAAKTYRNGGYNVILEGVIGPWVFPILKSVIGRFDYFLMHTTLESACERVASRSCKDVSLGKVERMHPQFEAIVPGIAQHMINTELASVDVVAELVLAKIKEGSCEVHAV